MPRKLGPKRVMKKTARRITRRPINYQIRRVVKSMAESKISTYQAINQSIACADSTVLPTFIPLTPAVAQGSAENQRSGNRIMATSGVIEGYVNMKPYDAVTNTFPSVKVKMWIVSYKNRNVSSNSDPTLALADFSTFFDSGASGIPMQGNIIDMIATVNTDRWTVHKSKVVTLSLGGASTSYPDTTGPHEGSGTYQKYFKFYFGKHLGKLIYDDVVGSGYPTNKNLYIVFQSVTTDGSARQTGPIAEFHYKYDVKFKDF